MMKGFTAKSWKMRWFPAPEELISEDYFAFDERKGIMAVADGITREKSSYLDDIFSLRLKSKARMAAERAVRAFIISLRNKKCNDGLKLLVARAIKNEEGGYFFSAGIKVYGAVRLRVFNLKQDKADCVYWENSLK